YVDNTNDVRCNQCQIRIFNLTRDMKPFEEHRRQSPACPFVKQILGKDNEQDETISNQTSSPAKTKSQKFKKTETSTYVNDIKREEEKEKDSVLNFFETKITQQARDRTFSHWPHKVPEIHKLLSSNCPYVKFIMNKSSSLNNIRILNESSRQTSPLPPTVSNGGVENSNVIRSNEIVLTAACNAGYIEIPKRHASFASWPQESLPSVDDMAKSGFFYTGTNTIVTCFYCNGSLQNWGKNEEKTVLHRKYM
ncbi:unnamed protein product, partial [Didymodactylos carnosus]